MYTDFCMHKSKTYTMKHKWTKAAKEVAHKALLSQVNSKNKNNQLSQLDTVEYGDDGFARYTDAVGNGFLVEDSVNPPAPDSLDSTSTEDSTAETGKKAAPKKAAKKAAPKKAAAKKTSK